MRASCASIAPSLLVLLAHCALIGGSGCLFQEAVPDGARIDCTSSGDCPDAMQCAGLLGRCVPEVGDTTPPDAVTGLSTELLAASGPLEVTVVADEPLARAPLVQVGAVERAAVPVDPAAEPGAVVARFDAGELGAGIHPVIAILIDASGNAGLVAVGAVTVDAAPPALDPDVPVSFTITAPAGSLVAAPTHVTLGARVTLTFDADEPLGARPDVVARGPIDVPFAFAFEADGVFVFELAVTAPLPAGGYRVEAALVDVAGNSATVEVPLPAPGFVAAEIVPSPCVARTADGVAVCTDFDGDGVDGLSDACPTPAPLDCDDTDPLVHSGARELAGDGKDNDCGADGDMPLDESTAVFADADAAPGGNGSRDAPFASLYEANDAARGQGKTLALRAGSFGVVPAGWFTSTDVVGGLDASWAASDPTARTHVAFVDGRDTVFPVDVPHTYVALDLVSDNSLIDATAAITLVRTRLTAANSAMLAPAATFIDSDVDAGFVTVSGRLFAAASRFAAEVDADEGLILRSRHVRQIGTGGTNKLEVVSSSVVVVDQDRGSITNGKLVFWGSTLRALSASPLSDVGPALQIGDGEAFFFASAVEGRQMLFLETALGGSVFMLGAVVSAQCGVLGGACLVDVNGAGCGDDASCDGWVGVTAVADLAPDDADPFLLTNPALVGPGPALLEQGAPTSTAGDLLGRCRDTAAPGIGANERD